jgi:hypothetical protein
MKSIRQNTPSSIIHNALLVSLTFFPSRLNPTYPMKPSNPIDFGWFCLVGQAKLSQKFENPKELLSAIGYWNLEPYNPTPPMFLTLPSLDVALCHWENRDFNISILLTRAPAPCLIFTYPTQLPLSLSLPDS